ANIGVLSSPVRPPGAAASIGARKPGWRSGCSREGMLRLGGGTLPGRGRIAGRSAVLAAAVAGIVALAVVAVVVAVADRAIHALDRLQAFTLAEADQGHALGIAADHRDPGGAGAHQGATVGNQQH